MLKASGTELTTVAMRRVGGAGEGSLIGTILQAGVAVLPNTAGCHTAAEALLVARLAREALDTDWVKLEVVADDITLLPDPVELLEAAQLLVADGFTVLPYTNDDRYSPAASRGRLRRGDAARRADRLRSRHQEPAQHRDDRRPGEVPVILDAGIGTASDAALAMELGCARGASSRPRSPAPPTPSAWRSRWPLAVGQGRAARNAGRIPRRWHAVASSPTDGLPAVAHA